MINSDVLAYLGDAVYEVYIRNSLIKKNILKIELLNEQAQKYVCATGQKEILMKLINDNFLTDEELDIVRHGRNNKRSYHPKNVDIITYKYATGFEALIGYLYLNNETRLREIFEQIEV